VDLDSCVNCNAGLISASTICPQCGWPKDKPIEPVKEESEEIKVPIEPTEIKNRLSRPSGVRLISFSYMLFGISLMLFGIIFVSAVMFLVMSDAMGELGGIGGGMGNMPMLPGMGGMDASTKSSLNSIIDLNRIVGSFSASEIEMRMSSSSTLNVDVIMEILEEASIIALIEISLGLLILIVGACLAKGKKWARPVSIIFSIISIPFIIAFVTADNQILLVLAAFNGIVIYYMLKAKARDYFNQTLTKKLK
jgi:hypothetical protein